MTQLNQTCKFYEAEIRALKGNLDDLSSYKSDYLTQENENSKLKLKFHDLEKVFYSILFCKLNN